jgi:cyclophilin family peptidyl-prolyl cis-trans isomerase
VHRSHRFKVLSISVALATVATLGLGACGSDSDGGDSTTIAGTEETGGTVDSAATADTPAPEAAGGAAAPDDSQVECPPVDGSATKRQSFPATGLPMCIDPATTYQATVDTTKGTFVITFDAAKAPKTVNNFVTLARFKYFDGIGFHRVVPGFVIQGGDPQGTGMGDPGYRFEDELPQAGEYKIGSLAMANAGPNTNGSQFFVITGENGAALPPQYSLFGQVTEGMDVVMAIDALGVGDGPPSEPVVMNSVTITELEK